MEPLSLINHFQSPRDQEISKLAYYGEFFANLDLDDGYKTILYQLLIEYIGSLQNTLPPSLVATVIEDTTSRVSVTLELRTPATQDITTVLREVQSISTRLQKDFHMYPLIQRYPFSLDDAIALPIEFQGPIGEGDLAWRHRIHQEESRLLKLKRQLETVLQQIALLQ
jgi:hypothetical protein